MFKRFLIAALSALSIVLPSMGQSKDADRGLTVTFDFGICRGFGSYDDDIGFGGASRSYYTAPNWEYGALLNPRLGYRFDHKRELGLQFRYQSPYSSRTYSYGAYFERTYVHFPKTHMRLFVDWQYLYNHTKDYDSHNFTEVGAAPGIAYHVPGTGLDVRLCYLFLGFNDGPRELKELGGCLGRSCWIIDAGLRRLSIGMSYTF